MGIAVIFESVTCHLAATKKLFRQQASTKILQILTSVPLRNSEITSVVLMGLHMLN